MPLDVGLKAPDFELPLRPGEAPLRLSDYEGERPIVLLFFPLAFSPVCTEEFEMVARGYDDWVDLGAQVIGISVDSPFVTQKFAEECGARFPILSDFNGTVSEAYHVRCEDFFGLEDVAHRACFVLDREGKVVYSWMTEDPDVMPNFQEIRDVVRSLAAG